MLGSFQWGGGKKFLFFFFFLEAVALPAQGACSVIMQSKGPSATCNNRDNVVISWYQRAQSCTRDRSSSAGFNQILVFPLLAENLRSIKLSSSATSASLGSWLKVSFALCRVWSPSTGTSRKSGISLVKYIMEQLCGKAHQHSPSLAVWQTWHKKKKLRRAPHVFIQIQNLFKYTHQIISLLAQVLTLLQHY